MVKLFQPPHPFDVAQGRLSSPRVEAVFKCHSEPKAKNLVFLTD
jgi:hypothetical protein